MTPLSVPVHPEARAEFEAILDWYEQRDPRVAAVFVDRITDAFASIRNSPRRYRLWPGRAGAALGPEVCRSWLQKATRGVPPREHVA